MKGGCWAVPGLIMLLLLFKMLMPLLMLAEALPSVVPSLSSVLLFVPISSLFGLS